MLSVGCRVDHSNVCRAYGAGVITEIIASHIRPPSKARVHFDGELCPRLVWLGDLEPIVTPAPMAGSPAGLRIVYPLDRAGEAVVA